jgi:hypothetical protein
MLLEVVFSKVLIPAVMKKILRAWLRRLSEVHGQQPVRMIGWKRMVSFFSIAA